VLNKRDRTLVDPSHPHHWEVDPMNVRTPGSLWMSDQLDTLTGVQQPLSHFRCSVVRLDLFRIDT